MNKIEWCAKKNEGLILIEPNPNIADAYTKKSEEALNSIALNTIKDWKIATAYYAVYFSLYSILAKLGIRCEIHSCTIEFARSFLKEYLDEEDILFIKKSLKARIDSQYYIDRTVPDAQYEDMIKRAPRFFIKCKATLIKLNEKRINMIRSRLTEELPALAR